MDRKSDKEKSHPITGFEVMFYSAGKDTPFHLSHGYEELRRRVYEKQREVDR